MSTVQMKELKGKLVDTVEKQSPLTLENIPVTASVPQVGKDVT